MKALLLLTCLVTLLPGQSVTWTLDHESSVQTALTSLAKTLPKTAVLVGRTSVPDTRVAVVINADGHLLAPLIPALDQSDAPYLLYRPDGSRLTLTTVKENAKRSVALLKIENPPADLTPIRISKITDHTVVIPTSAPIASLGETPSLFVDHLEFPPPEDATAFRLDSVFHRPGTAVLDLSGALIGTTLKAREDNTPALMIVNLIGEISELDALLGDETLSPLPDLPTTPELTKEEIKELTTAPLTKARQRFIQSTHPTPTPCVLISNDSTQATHSVIGTIVRPNGLILTKASELGPEFEVRYFGRSYPGVLLATDEKTDLALVGIAASGMPVIRWSDQPPTPGCTVASPILLQESTDDMVSEPTSYLGAFSHLLKESLPTVHATSQVTSLGLTTEQIDSKLVIVALKSDTPAYESGLSPGDVISTIDGTPVTSRAGLTAFLDRCEVGQSVTVEVTRADTSKEFTVALIAPNLIPPTTGVTLEGGVAMVPSVRRTPFPDTLVHTAPLNAWDCGSPLFDLRGRALGLNIAAVAPTRTLALTPPVIREALDRLLAKTRAF